MMDNPNRSSEDQLAQQYFQSLISNPQAEPPGELDWQTAQLVRDLVENERQSAPAYSQVEEAKARVWKRLQTANPELARNTRPTSAPGLHWQPKSYHKNELFNSHSEREYQAGVEQFQEQGKLAWRSWGRFLLQAGMATTVILVAAIIALILINTRPSEVTPTATGGQYGAGGPTATTQPASKTPVTSDTNSTDVILKGLLEPVLSDVASLLNLSQDNLMSRLKAGESIAQIAKSQKVDLQKVNDTMLNSFKQQLEMGVQAGKWSQAQSLKAQEALPDFLQTFLNNKIPANTSTSSIMPKLLAASQEAIAKELKLSLAELESRLNAGQTISEIASAQNVDLNSLNKAVLNNIQTQLAQLVKDGKITQEQADQNLKEAPASIEKYFVIKQDPTNKGG
ncbi:MAG TPA: hypothetical protein VH186_35170 [Chloroflexia bacterium]|nr:hypothetical protein [Chloroflexia bacterium]